MKKERDSYLRSLSTVCASHSVMPGPAASGPLVNLEIRVLRPNPRLTESETLRVELSNQTSPLVILMPTRV